jgi:Ni,Fe-hydrogenase III large subunit
MTFPLEPIVMVSTLDGPQLELTLWARMCDEALAAGDRMITLFGRVAPHDTVCVTAVLLGAEGPLRVLRAHAPRGASFSSLTPRHPCMQMFERELWEQTGLTPEGHPWLKPVRFEGARQQRMTAYPFFSVRGHDVHEVGVGPIHASVIEPGHFRFMCHGERVQHLEIQLGYQHRGVEALLLQRPPHALTSLVETVVGDSSIAYAWGYCTALEVLSGVQAGARAELVRGVALELERVAMHLSSLTGLTTDAAFLQGGATYGRLRTAVINASMRVCGSRFGRGWLRPGGVRFGITETLRQDLRHTLGLVAKDIAEVNDLVLKARSVRSRLRGVGILSTQAACEIGMVGLAGRASDVGFDTRAALPGRLYQAHPVAALTETTGDCWSRMKLRMREIDASLDWVADVLEQPGLDVPTAQILPQGMMRPNTLCVSLREGFRGPVVQILETGADGHLVHHKVQDPSMLNWFGVALAMRENAISDFPICNKSFDLSYCGNDI